VEECRAKCAAAGFDDTTTSALLGGNAEQLYGLTGH
jgi:hypothetical protein